MKTYTFNKKEQHLLLRILLSLLLFVGLMITDKVVNLASLIGGKWGFVLPFLLFASIYALIGFDIVKKAISGIRHGQALDENFLMVVASIGAFALGIYRGFSSLPTEGFDEACAVMIFYQIGEFFQSFATNSSRKSISELMDLRPDYANLLKDGEIVVTPPDEIKIGDIIAVKPGEKIPLDGKIKKGSTALDTKALTGEFMHKSVKVGDEVLSGTLNISNYIEIEVTKEFYDSTVNKILELVESASDKKSKAENFISRFAKFYTPIVVFLSICLAVIPSIITGMWSTWIYRALNFLVVSCPCALVISVPLSFFAGIGLASKNKILIKGSNYLEKLSKANIFVFDKTGTLTKGCFTVIDVYPEENREEILRLACIAEKNSTHPIAKSILSYCNYDTEDEYELENIAGMGIRAESKKEIILCGNLSLFKKYHVPYSVADVETGTAVYVAKNGVFMGYIIISDEIKESSQETVQKLNKSGAKTVMLTGDGKRVAQHIALFTGVQEYKTNLLPQDKAKEIEKMLKEKKKHDVLCFIGDGINDAPSIMRADVGVAMGAIGSDAAIEAADIVLMQDELSDIIKAKEIAKITMRRVRQNVVFALGIKFLILVLSALGITNMWIAVFSDVGVAFLAILNALRIGNFNKDKK